MATLPNELIMIFEIEPIVKLVCIAVDCQNNLADYHGNYHCNLKHISIDETGRCIKYEAKPNPGQAKQ